MALPDCACVSVDSPLAISAAVISIVTFAIAAIGFILAAIAIFRSYRSAAQDAEPFDQLYKSAVREGELYRAVYALAPDFFEINPPGSSSRDKKNVSNQAKKSPGTDQTEHDPAVSSSQSQTAQGKTLVNAETPHSLAVPSSKSQTAQGTTSGKVTTQGGTDFRKVRHDKLREAAKFLFDMTMDVTTLVDDEKSKTKNSRLGWLRKQDDLLKRMQERTLLTPSLLFIRTDLLGLRVETICEGIETIRQEMETIKGYIVPETGGRNDW